MRKIVFCFLLFLSLLFLLDKNIPLALFEAGVALMLLITPIYNKIKKNNDATPKTD